MLAFPHTLSKRVTITHCEWFPEKSILQCLSVLLQAQAKALMLVYKDQCTFFPVLLSLTLVSDSSLCPLTLSFLIQHTCNISELLFQLLQPLLYQIIYKVHISFHYLPTPVKETEEQYYEQKDEDHVGDRHRNSWLELMGAHWLHTDSGGVFIGPN